MYLVDPATGARLWRAEGGNLPQDTFLRIALLGKWVLLRGEDDALLGVEIDMPGPVRMLIPRFFSGSTSFDIQVSGDAILVEKGDSCVDVFRPSHRMLQRYT